MLFILFAICLFRDAAAGPSPAVKANQKASAGPGVDQPFILPKGTAPISLPGGSNPFLVHYPGSHLFANEFKWNNGASTAKVVNLQVPIIKRDRGVQHLWKLNTRYRNDVSTGDFSYSHLVHPANNKLNIPFKNILPCLLVDGLCDTGPFNKAALFDESQRIDDPQAQQNWGLVEGAAKKQFEEFKKSKLRKTVVS